VCVCVCVPDYCLLVDCVFPVHIDPFSQPIGTIAESLSTYVTKIDIGSKLKIIFFSITFEVKLIDILENKLGTALPKD
jgi:hypothetical protein